LKRVFVVALGPPSVPLGAAFRTGGPLADQMTIAFHKIPLDVAAVLEAPIPSAFALAWIFVDRSVLDDPAVRVCQQRLSPLAPVTIAVHLPKDDPAWVPGVLQFEGGVILQPYSDTSFELVASLIKGFVAKERPGAAQTL
jgi:hypothetical protein